MRFSLALALAVVIILSGGYWYKSTAAICPAPLTYRLVELNESFSLSESEAKDKLVAAETEWEKSVNRELFVYDDSADFTVNFIFDERQLQSDQEDRQRRYLDGQLGENQELFAAIELAQKEYDNMSESYSERAGVYESRLAEYNQTVQKYNDRGGAPKDVFDELEDERLALDKESKDLATVADQLNSLAQQINKLSAEGNRLIDVYNRDVAEYNETYGFAREFTQGDYQGDQINIYEFSSENELQAVLLHEFGHALGIDHVEASSSVMYYLLEDTGEKPLFSTDDLEAFYAVCGTGNEWEHQVRKVIRQILSIF